MIIYKQGRKYQQGVALCGSTQMILTQLCLSLVGTVFVGQELENYEQTFPNLSDLSKKSLSMANMCFCVLNTALALTPLES